MAEAAPWLVVFPLRAARAVPPAWWARPLRPGWRHCLACCADGAGSLVVEHVGTHLVAQHWGLPVGALVAEMQESLTAMVLLVPPPAARHGAALRAPLTCVEAVKAVLGIRAPWVLTPRALFDHLRRRHGARVVLPATS
jgi:hypothetical protein